MRLANVLIVDDEYGPRESIRMTLKNTYTVSVAKDGQEALVKLYNGNYDVVTVDLKMPGMSGIEILKAIKTYDPNIEVVVVTGFGTFETARDAIRYGAFDYVSKPYDVKELSNTIEKSLRRRRMNIELKNLIKEVQIPDKSNVAEQEGGNREATIINKAKDFIKNYANRPNGSTDEDYLDFIKVLSRTLEMKDPYTHGHSDRVNYYSRLIADKMDLSMEFKCHIQRASFLHDIGKLSISDEILLRQGALSPEEWEIMKKHPERGVEMIDPLCDSQNIIPIVLHHHEKYDGKGYPYGLKGEDIPLGSRIIGVVDSYDAMTSHRPYSKAKTRIEAIQEIKRCSGTHFDQKIVDVFLQILSEEDNSENFKEEKQ